MADEKMLGHNGQNDFDFFIGEWTSVQRRLKGRLCGSTDWEEFEGRSVVRKTLDGTGNIDEVTFYRESGPLMGLTIRLYDPVSMEWSIYWADSRRGMTLPPQIGRFQNGVGEFYAHETHEGRHIFSRFLWTSSSPTTCRWEQAFSEDAGKTWETNWTADFTRIE